MSIEAAQIIADAITTGFSGLIAAIGIFGLLFLVFKNMGGK